MNNMKNSFDFNELDEITYDVTDAVIGVVTKGPAIEIRANSTGAVIGCCPLVL